MHTVEEAQRILRSIPRNDEEKKGRWIERAGKAFGLTRSQAKKIIYGEVKDLRAAKLDAMRTMQQELKDAAVKRRETLDGLQARLTEFRCNQGRGNAAGDSAGAAPAGGGSDGAGEGGLCSDRPSFAVVSGR